MCNPNSRVPCPAVPCCGVLFPDVLCCAALNCAGSAAEVTAERALLGHLDGSCHTPIAASARIGSEGRLALSAMILRPDGSAAHSGDAAAPADEAERLGRDLAAELLDAAGGRDFLA